MKNLVTFIFTAAVSLTCQAQITIEECYRKAQANYPLIEQYGLIEKSKEYTLSNIGKGWLPQVTFSIQATYQSDVTKLPIDLSQLGLSGTMIPSLSKDQYGATVEVSQTVWDGGAMKSQKESASASAEVDKKSVGVSVYAIRERVNQIYFGILLTQAQIEQNGLLQSQLSEIYRRMESYMKNGVANQSDLDAVNVDRLKAEQNLAKLRMAQKSYMEMLSQLVGEKLDETKIFIAPEVSVAMTGNINRPELELYDAQIRNLESQYAQLTSRVSPKLGLFVRGGYGKPGLNMLDDNFKAYYVGGMKLTWNIGGFYSKKSDKRLISNGIKSIETQRETFLFNTSLDIAQKRSAIDSYREQLEYDDKIIALRTSIRQASEVKMAGGTISGTDLSYDINAEQSAIQDKIIHRTEMLLAIYNLRFTTNN